MYVHNNRAHLDCYLVGAVDVAQQSVDPLNLAIVNPARLEVGQDSGYIDEITVVEMLF